MATKFVKYQNKNSKRKSEVPVTLDWNNAKMVRVHSIRAATKEILNMSRGLDVVKINIIGSPSTGKTTLAETLAHLCHSLSDIPYTVKKFTRNDLLDFETTLSSLQPTNHILIFDDVSFLTASANGRQIKKIEKAFTEIRHLPGGQDVKIIAIFNFHYNMAVSKYMRQSEVFMYTSIGSSEYENTINVIGKKYGQRILNFKKYFQESITTEKFTIILGKKDQKFTYRYKQPFVPMLYFNGISARLVVFPKREWIDPVCNICASSNTSNLKATGDIITLDNLLHGKYKNTTIIQAMKIKLFIMGASTYPKRVKQCMKEIDDAFKKDVFNINDLALHYNLIDKPTRVNNPIHKDLPKIWTGIK